MGAFRFKQFSVLHQRSPFKIGTDSILLGAIAPVANIPRVLDIGAGCGIIGLMLLQRGAGWVTGIEVDAEAATEAGENVRNSCWSNRMKIVHGNFCEERLIRTLETFDLIVSNPPFFSKALKSPNDRKNIARHNNILPFNMLAKHAAMLLSEQGCFCLILPSSEAAAFLAAAAKSALTVVCRYHIFSKPDMVEARQILILKKHPGKEPEDHSLTICNPDGSYSEEFIRLTKDFYLDF